MAKDPNVPSEKFEVELSQGKLKQATTTATRADMWLVPVDDLHVIEGFNVRITGPKYDEGIQEIKQSIINEGFYRDKPLAGYVAVDETGNSSIFVTDGHRRLEALRLAIAEGAAIDKVPVLIKPTGTSLEDLTVAMTKTGTPLTPYEMALVCKRLVNYGREPGEIAKRLGLTKRYVDDLLLLMSASASLRRMVEQDKISATTAVQQLRTDPKSASRRITEAVKTAQKSGRTRATGRHIKPPPALPNGAGKAAYQFKAKAGEMKTLEDIKLYQLLADGAWYALTDTAGEVEITQDVNIKITVSCKPRRMAEMADEAADL